MKGLHNGILHRLTALLLCLCVAFSAAGGLSVGMLPRTARAEETDTTPAPTKGTTKRISDPLTYNDYEKRLELDRHSRYAGRLWADKSVAANGGEEFDLSGDKLKDGYDPAVKNKYDFTHMYSVLGSTQETIGVPPVRTVIVFDNSGSMYSSLNNATDDDLDGSTLWERQRIALTIEALNRAIDSLMLASPYNEVSVVLFGDGAQQGVTGESGTYAYDGNDSAVTVLPMKHYTPDATVQQEYQNNNGVATSYTPYFVGGWKTTGANPDGAHPYHTDKLDDTKHTYPSSSGWVFVDNVRTGLKADSKGADPAWKDSGWNNCGNNNYTAYANGTTNIQAGMYQGMQELLRADKTEQVGGVTYQAVPSLVLLTDGAVTDSLDNWMNPTTSSESTSVSVPSKSMGFVNDFANKYESFIGQNHGSNADSSEALNSYSWNQFIRADARTSNEDPNNKYVLYAKAEASDNTVHTEGTGTKTIPSGTSLAAMKGLASQYTDDQAYMIFTYLLTSSFYKQVVKSAYNVSPESDWNIYTVTVDMPDPKEDGFTAGFGNPNKVITSNPAMMDPQKYFNEAWLKKANYIKADGTNYYYEGTIGYQMVEGVKKAIETWNKWSKGEDVELKTFRSIQSARNFKSTSTPQYTISLIEGYDESNQPSHGNFYRVFNLQTEKESAGATAGDYYIPTKADAKEQAANLEEGSFTLNDLSYNYVNMAFYASTAKGAAQDLAQVFTQIVDAIVGPIFTPVGGNNALNVSDAVTYMDPIGKYMEVKDVDSLVLFGHRINYTSAGHYDYQFASNNHEPNELFKMGWYKVSTDADGNFTWLKEEADNFHETSKPPTDTTGWMLFLDTATARQFVPNIPEEGSIADMPEEQREKFEHTKYSFFRLALDGPERDKLHLNPAYYDFADEDAEQALIGKMNIDPNDSTKENYYTNFQGVYKLSDLRVWIEDTGTYNDTLSGDILSSGRYDEALFVNVPAAMLPTYKVTIDYTAGGTDGVYKLQTTTPLRVIYYVGMESSVMTADGNAVDLTKVKAEYLTKHKVAENLVDYWNTGYSRADYTKDIPEKHQVAETNWYDPEDVVFYSNYYTGNTYDYDENDGVEPQPYGEAVLTFSPANDNRYYFFQSALPLYERVYQYSKSTNSWSELDGQTASTTAISDAEGKVFAHLFYSQSEEMPEDAAKIDSFIKDKIEELKISGSPGDGDIVVFKNDLIGSAKVTHNYVTADKYYFILMDHYDHEGGDDYTDGTQKAQTVEYALSRRGKEFGSGYGAEAITAAQMLCWMDIEGRSSKTYDFNAALSDGGYSTNIPASERVEGSNWVVGVDQGAIRAGMMNNNMVSKGGELAKFDDSISEVGARISGYYSGNRTHTANNNRMPIVGKNSSLADGNVLIEMYLGNNGRLVVSDTMFSVTKTVLNNDANGEEPPEAGKMFGYTVKIDDDTYRGPSNAISLARVTENGSTWRRLLDYIDLFTSARYFLRDENGIEIRVNEKGEVVKDAASGDYTGDYYVYAGDSDTEDGVNTFRLYRSTNQADSNYKDPVSTEYVEVTPVGDKGKVQFKLKNVWLVPVSTADNGSYTPDGKVEAPDGSKIRLSNYLVLDYDPTEENSTEIKLNERDDLDIEAVYLTRTLYFGGEAGSDYAEGKELPGDAVVPLNWPWRDETTNALVYGPVGTTYFELGDGQGLLFNGLDSGADFTVTEVLSEENLKAGYQFQSLEYKTSATTTEKKEAKSFTTGNSYAQTGETTGGFERNVHYINSWNRNKEETQINGKDIPKTDSNTKPGVDVGDTITYEIDWVNNATKDGAFVDATVTITDQLDDGVDFVSASVVETGLTLNANKAVENEKEKELKETVYTGDGETAPYIRYDADKHTVTWNLSEQVKEAKGTVKLTVRVNKDAPKYWDYDGNGIGGDERVTDELVRNRATVSVADNSYTTNYVQNPVGGPHKTETKIEDGTTNEDTPVSEEKGNLIPRPDTNNQEFVGPLVKPRDQITYKVTWRNYENVPAAVSIRDQMDPNVKIISATFDPTQTTITNEEGEEKTPADWPPTGSDTVREKTTLAPATVSNPADPNEKPASQKTDGADGTVTYSITGSNGKPESITKNIIEYYRDAQEEKKDTAGNITQEAVPANSVIWNLGIQPAQSQGYVELVVEVLDKAVDVGYVSNTAYAKVGNDDWLQTETIDNPTPHQQKTEVTPGDGELVAVGEEITYAIDWRNSENTIASVLVMDTLDPGVDFVSASVADNTYTYDPTATPAPGVTDIMPTSLGETNVKSMWYYPNGGTFTIKTGAGRSEDITVPAHTVVWYFEDQTPGSQGIVNLTVRVNEKAKIDYGYNEEAEIVPPDENADPDYEVLDQAKVYIDNTPTVTNVVENPVLEKSETDPGNGQPVGVGDQITYRVGFAVEKNDDGTGGESYTIVMDTLDPGVDYVVGSAKVNLPKDLENEVKYFKDAVENYEYEVKTEVAGETKTEKKYIDIPAHTVFWNLGWLPGGTVGEVELTVTVNEKAQLDYDYNDDASGLVPGTDPANPNDNKVRDQARVKFDDDPFVKTNKVENPMPEKKETSPGAGQIVGIGDVVEYDITWFAKADADSYVVVLDTLDPGVDFVEATVPKGTTLKNPNGKLLFEAGESYTYNITPGGQTVDSENDITLGEQPDGFKARTVVWDLGIQKAGTSGTVHLKVKVNANAKLDYDYNTNADGFEGQGDAGGLDQMIHNQARVKIGNENEVKTNKVDNTLQGKTEINPGEGKLVSVGDQITYQVGFSVKDFGTDEKGNAKQTYVVVMDTLDPGVDFKTNRPDGTPDDSATATFFLPEGKQTVEGQYYKEKGQFTYLSDVTFDGVTKPVPIDIPAHTIVWNIGWVPGGTQITADLKVTVNEKAKLDYDYNENADGFDGQGEDGHGNKGDLDHEVFNQARIKFSDDPFMKTNEVENPVTEKEETTPGAGQIVGIGDVVEYDITWAAKSDADSYVVVLDTLDPGVDFQPNADQTVPNGTYYENGGTLRYKDSAGQDYLIDGKPFDLTIPARTVVWDLGVKEAGTSGTVHLTVKVNEKAKLDYDYNGDADGFEGQGDAGGLDQMIHNQARVKIGNENEVKTNKVDNTLQGKTEINPGEGKLVGVGDQITYQVGFSVKDFGTDETTGKKKQTYVVVMDTLDPGVDFKTNRPDGAPDDSATVIAPSDKTTTKGQYFKDAVKDFAYKVETVVNGTTQTETKYIDIPAHTVLWDLGWMDGGTLATVELKVTVNDKAKLDYDYNETADGFKEQSTTPPDYKVLNQARIKFSDDPFMNTNIVENPVTEKEETKPGDREIVGIGQLIEYKIHWENNHDQEAKVTIIDPLDVGVDFVAASFGSVTLVDKDEDGTITQPDNSKDSPVKSGTSVTILRTESDIPNQADPNKVDLYAHSVRWTFTANPNTSGDVTLKVRVNEQATVKWGYDAKADKGSETVGETDHDVYNRASVQVGDNKGYTNVVENPVPEKQEQTPGPDVGVKVGDEITYRIYWKNSHSEPAKVVITDPLDDGLDFVSASFGENAEHKLEITENTARPSDGIYEYKSFEELNAQGDPKVTIQYDDNEGKRVVRWTLLECPANDEGYVELTVKVNEKAKETWGYTPVPDGYVGTLESEGVLGGASGEKEDQKVVDRAYVQVNDHGGYTSEVENPLPQKTEVTPGDGKGVKVGDVIEYSIHWKNTKDGEADVVIYDPLDSGVDFESASITVTLASGDEQTKTQTLTLEAGTDKTPPLKDAYGEVVIEYLLEGKEKEYPARTVRWTLPKRPKDAEGDVYLKVVVNEKAYDKWTYKEETGDNLKSHNIGGQQGEEDEKDSQVIDRAVVEIDHNPSYTNTVRNPLPGKTETSPGAGDLVGVGEQIDYEISWANGQGAPAKVIITDPLDKGVNFVQASVGDEVLTSSAIATENEKGETILTHTANGITISYNKTTHTVVWELGERAVGESGKVELKVEVNENAAKTWVYEDTTGKQADEVAGGKDGDGKDYRVRDRAKVQVGNQADYTDEVENPVPDKEELNPGDGQMVGVGQEITYAVHWENGYDKDALVVITDPLDIGADFVSASFGRDGAYADMKLAAGEDAKTFTAADDDKTVAVNPETHARDVAIQYAGTAADGNAARMVTWSFWARPKTSGDVLLTIKVNADAVKTWTYDATGNFGAEAKPNETQKDYEVLNRARVEVDHKGGFTAIVENPVPEKHEETPGAGASVKVGDAIDYTVHWTNGHDEPASVTVTDPLDPGVDFVSASFGGVTLGADKASATGADGSGNISIAAKVENGRTVVTWTLENRAAKAEGDVRLTVRVNENARGQGKVENQAEVKVGNDAGVKTEIIPNPTGPSKTETEINGKDVSDELEPSVSKDGYTGPMVDEGDEVTYRIRWVNNATENGELVTAKITVRDPLDKGVDFVSAAFTGKDENGDEQTIRANTDLKKAGPAKLDGGNVTVEYDEATRTVVWTLEDRAPGVTGDVFLTVRVNRLANRYWQYGTGDTPGVDDAIKDNEIVNRASVQVNNGSMVYTDVLRNPLDAGDLMVTKNVTGAGDLTRDFHFKVELSDKSVEGVYGQMTFKAGVAEFALKHMQSALAAGLPAGVDYSVTEVEAGFDGYVTWATNATGKIPLGDQVTVEFVNDMPEPNVPKTGDDLGTWLTLMLVSAVGLAVTAAASRRKGLSRRG